MAGIICLTCKKQRVFLNGSVVKDPENFEGTQIEQVDYLKQFPECVERATLQNTILKKDCEIAARDHRPEVI